MLVHGAIWTAPERLNVHVVGHRDGWVRWQHYNTPRDDEWPVWKLLEWLLADGYVYAGQSYQKPFHGTLLAQGKRGIGTLDAAAVCARQFGWHTFDWNGKTWNTKRYDESIFGWEQEMAEARAQNEKFLDAARQILAKGLPESPFVLPNNFLAPNP